MASIPQVDKGLLTWAQSIAGRDVSILQIRSNQANTVYQLKAAKKSWFLKLGPGLALERERLEWLQGRLPVPQLAGYNETEDRCALLTTALPGMDLAQLSAQWPASKVEAKLGEALRTFHAVDISRCPFGQSGPHNVLLHGDACLPNFIFKGDESLSGYVDLLYMGAGDATVDLSAAVWSLQYNLGPAHGLSFLKHYGIQKADSALVQRLMLQYAQLLAEQSGKSRELFIPSRLRLERERQSHRRASPYEATAGV